MGTEITLLGSVFLFAFGVVLFIAWVLLPFAMFGLKPLLRELIAETKRTNALLERGPIPVEPPAPQ